jgi:hypothetical protein
MRMPSTITGPIKEKRLIYSIRSKVLLSLKSGHETPFSSTNYTALHEKLNDVTRFFSATHYLTICISALAAEAKEW